MSEKANRSFHPRLALLLVPAVLAATLAAAAQEGKPDAPGGPHEGIKVHGHWTIEVLNPDGRLVTHREFENALALGPMTIAPMLGRAETVGLWSVQVAGDIVNGLGPCLDPVPNSCFLSESNDPITGPNVFHNLTISAPFRPDANAGKLTLSGSFTVQNAAQIFYVSTAVNDCAPTVAPASCLNDDYHFNFDPLFSSAGLGPISVAVGQTVLVSVVYSFS
jgi:hypothetical protein